MNHTAQDKHSSTRRHISLSEGPLSALKALLDPAGPHVKASIRFDSGTETIDSVMECIRSLVERIHSVTERIHSVIESIHSVTAQTLSCQSDAAGPDFHDAFRHKLNAICRRNESLGDAGGPADTAVDPQHSSNRPDGEQDEGFSPGMMSCCPACVAVRGLPVGITDGPMLRRAGWQPVSHFDQSLCRESHPFCGAVRIFRDAGERLRHGPRHSLRRRVLHRREEHRRRGAGDSLFQPNPLFIRRRTHVGNTAYWSTGERQATLTSRPLRFG
jgi:hypothetical protein